MCTQTQSLCPTHTHTHKAKQRTMTRKVVMRWNSQAVLKIFGHWLEVTENNRRRRMVAGKAGAAIKCACKSIHEYSMHASMHACASEFVFARVHAFVCVPGVCMHVKRLTFQTHLINCISASYPAGLARARLGQMETSPARCDSAAACALQIGGAGEGGVRVQGLGGVAGSCKWLAARAACRGADVSVDDERVCETGVGGVV